MQAKVASESLAFNLTWHDWLNMQSLCDISEVIAHAALARENSRGAHFREDFPDAGDLESSYYTVARQHGQSVAVEREPVKFTRVKPGETILSADEPETLVG
jgi:fumarate reductase flavoprotein subunit